MNLARAVFCALVLARFVVIGGLGTPAARLEVPALTLMIGASLVLVVRSRREGASPALLVASTLADAVVCFLALLADVLWPWPGYGGLLATPDVAALLVPPAVAAFRLDRRAVVAGVVASIALGVVLFVLDVSLNRARLSYDPNGVPLFALFLVTIGVVSLRSATRTLDVVRLGAEATLRAERAHGNLGVVLHEHHDVKTALSAAMLDADLLRRDVRLVPEQERARVERRVDGLAESLSHVAASLGRIRVHTRRELEAMQRSATAEVGRALDGALAVVQRRYRDVTFAVTPAAERSAVAISGGAETLERVLLNLVVNACEGNGGESATRVTIDARELAGGRVAVVVSDDGPGFREGRAKVGGTGLGLRFVEGVVDSSGGRLVRKNGADGGAEVTLELPAAPL